jgi:hypothetical protein
MDQGTVAERKCSKCSGTMEAGLLLDRTQALLYPAIWADGSLKKKWLGGLKVADNRLYRVETWRCKDCGYLESYAKNRTGLYET